MHRIASALLLFLCSAPVALSQAIPTRPEPVARYTLSVGYTRVRANAPPGGCECFGTNGGYASGAFAFATWFRIAAEVNGSHADHIGPLGQNLTLLTYTAGPQVVFSARHFEPFAQVLVGGAHGSDSYFPTSSGVQSSTSSFAWNAGGGVDFGLTEHLGVRLAEVQYLHTSLPNAANDAQNHLVLAAGLVFRFGSDESKDDHARAQANKLIRSMDRRSAALR